MAEIGQSIPVWKQCGALPADFPAFLRQASPNCFAASHDKTGPRAPGPERSGYRTWGAFRRASAGPPVAAQQARPRRETWCEAGMDLPVLPARPSAPKPALAVAHTRRTGPLCRPAAQSRRAVPPRCPSAGPVVKVHPRGPPLALSPCHGPQNTSAALPCHKGPPYGSAKLCRRLGSVATTRCHDPSPRPVVRARDPPPSPRPVAQAYRPDPSRRPPPRGPEARMRRPPPARRCRPVDGPPASRPAPVGRGFAYPA